MSAPVTISIDAMGGDHAPDMVVEGVRLAHVRLPHVRYLLFGDAARIDPLVERFPELRGVCSVRHTDEVVTNDAKPGQVLRTGRRSSMWLAVSAVSQGEAAGVVSAGNTGALMAVSKFVLRTLPGIDRPAIAGLFPTVRGETVMLDLGANVDCNANNLIEFAVMGEVFARAVLGLEQPTIGILNVGSEDLKGHDAVRAAANALRESPLPIRFHGFVEGNDICQGTVDVVVTDGFTGNIALKTAEGTVKFYSSFLKEAFQSSLLAKLGFLFAKQAIAKVKVRTDPRRYNGAMFLGLNGIAVKSHGGTDAFGFANAIGVAVDLVAHGYNERIRHEFERFHAGEAAAEARAAGLG
ncbi:phosphate acyltransferase PlsX [Magnetospirillum sp. UT-4]|uniref:phosphate acyltransferase PlsX n=1 Tax=Magnetospirillum sp. UT-4 TaxID=2681467 RepID=UPI00138605D1|nr:phosphate acyltransferase PlsX [Magnetospirillum sp. UT-4]CAA7617854.1 Phosphate acyltransferase [Magnetospirillum sp. UT-4]